MKIRFEMTAAETTTIKSIIAMTDDNTAKSVKFKLQEILSDNHSEITETKEDGSVNYELSVSEMATISIANWALSIYTSCKSLVMGVVDTYKNIAKMFNIKSFKIDGNEVENRCHKITTTVHIHDMDIRVSSFVKDGSDDEAEQKKLAEMVIDKFSEKTAE